MESFFGTEWSLEYLSGFYLVFVLTLKLSKVKFSSLNEKAFDGLDKTRFLYMFQDKNATDSRWW